jgi:hypothetical protein
MYPLFEIVSPIDFMQQFSFDKHFSHFNTPFLQTEDYMSAEIGLVSPYGRGPG